MCNSGNQTTQNEADGNHAKQLDGFAYDAFLSYSTDPDYQLVREIEEFLETFHLIKTEPGVMLRPLQFMQIQS